MRIEHGVVGTGVPGSEDLALVDLLQRLDRCSQLLGRHRDLDAEAPELGQTGPRPVGPLARLNGHVVPEGLSRRGHVQAVDRAAQRRRPGETGLPGQVRVITEQRVGQGRVLAEVGHHHGLAAVVGQQQLGRAGQVSQPDDLAVVAPGHGADRL